MSGRQPPDVVIWNEVECGAYTADLPLWEELAAENEGPVIELGCGAGRVVTHLAQKTGQLVVGVDRDADLVEAVWSRMHGRKGNTGDAEVGDVRGFELYFEFQLALAPMQLIQLLPGRVDRICCLACVADHLLPGGRAAFALVEEMPIAAGADVAQPLPDVRQVDEWIYSSLPLAPEVDEERVLLRRLRQTVDPEGEMSEELNELELQRVTATALEEEAAEVGLGALGRRNVPATEHHVGSTVVVLGKEA
jgi:SAM-dependent methyltransferase